MDFIMGLLVFIIIIVLASIKQINEYERGIKFTLGKFSKVLEPGWNLVFPIFQSFKKSFIGQKMVLWEYDPALQHNILNSQGTMYNKNRNLSGILKS